MYNRLVPIKNLLSFLSIFFLFLIPFFILTPHASSDTLDDIDKQLATLKDDLARSISASKPVESELKRMQDQIKGIKNRVAFIDQDIAVKRKNIEKGYNNLREKEKIISQAIRDFYIKSYSDSPLAIFLSQETADDITQALAYQRARTNQNKAIITNIALSLVDLEQKKEDLKNEQEQLIRTKVSLDEQSAQLDKIVSGAKAYQTQLSGQISQLSAKQQALIAAKLGSLGLPTSAYTTKGGCSSDLTNGKDPGFSPRFGAFSFGVPHRVGMSQYGANGRARAGQSYQDILSFYFPNTQMTTVGTGTNIHVVGTNEYGQSFDDNWNIEEYVKHIYEVPTGDQWDMGTLKSQAIAARSYALATTNNGAGTICPSQSCQVVKKELNSDRWLQAVNDTAGQVLTNGGSPIQAWFSSTAGGYTFGSGDVWGGGNKPWTRNALDASSSVGSFSDLRNNAYDKDSPWFYCDWGARSQYAGTAWLKSNEMADIVNSILLVQADSSADPHILQTDKSDSNAWSEDKVRQELSRYRTPFNNISSASVNADFGSGRSTNISFEGDGGSVSFSSDVFKKYFNLRAPSNINIVGPLYNIEKQ